MKPPEFGQAEWVFFNLEKVGRDFTLSGKEFHNADLYRVNLKNDPRCVCGHLFEDAIHFFS
jgi:hypothetical protein